MQEVYKYTLMNAVIWKPIDITIQTTVTLQREGIFSYTECTSTAKMEEIKSKYFTEVLCNNADSPPTCFPPPFFFLK